MEHKVHICTTILGGTSQGNLQQVCRNFLVLLLIHLYAFKFFCDSIDPRNILQIFLLTHHNAHNELINPGQFIPVYIIELCHEALMIFVNPSFFVFLIQQNHSPYICMFLQALCFPHPTKSLSIHMHVPLRSLVSLSIEVIVSLQMCMCLAASNLV